MMRNFRLPATALGILLIVMTGSMAATQLRRIDPGRLTVVTPQRAQPISPADARILESRLSRLPAAEVLKVPPVALAPEPISLELPLNPALIVEAGTSNIEGLGLGTSQINVAVIGLANAKGRIVTLSTNSGYLSTTRLRLDENGTANAILRSDGIGPAAVTASSAGLGSTRVPVDYKPPVTTLLASVVGGLAGGTIRMGSKQRRRRGKTAVALLISVLLGMLVFALYAIGVNVLPITPSVTVGAVLVFAVSGLGAFLGPRVLGNG